MLRGTTSIRRFSGALGDRQSSVFAVTGNPVPFYFHYGFLRQVNSDDFSDFSL
jgi:hypothetical protein